MTLNIRHLMKVPAKNVEKGPRTSDRTVGKRKTMVTLIARRNPEDE